MQHPHPLARWSHALRVVLVLALLAIAPLYERGHVMPGMGMMHGMAMDDTGMMAGHGTAGHDGPAKSGPHDAACRIMCFGWVELATPARPHGLPVSAVMVIAPAAVALPAGITPSPTPPPPKSVSFV